MATRLDGALARRGSRRALPEDVGGGELLDGHFTFHELVRQLLAWREDGAALVTASELATAGAGSVCQDVLVELLRPEGE